MSQARAGRLSLVQKFLVLGLATIVPTGVALGIILARQIQDRLLEQARAETSLIAGALITPLLTEEDLAGLPPDRFARLDRLIRETVIPRDVAQVKVWNRAFTVVYSNDPSVQGRTYEPEEDLEEALEGETAAEISDLEGTEHASLRGLGQALEVYVPIRFGAEVGGAFEIYRPYRPIAAAIAADQRRLYAVLAAGLVALFAVLFRAVRRASKTLERQAQELGALYAREHETVTRLRELDGLKSDIVATASHEVRTPLTATRGALETLVHRGEQMTREEIDRMLRIALTGAERLQGLLEDLHTISTLYSGERAPAPELVDLRAFLDGMAAASERRVRVQAPDGACVETDATALGQIVRLLLDNANKFSPPESDVVIWVGGNGGEVRVAFEYQGPGIPPAERERIFEPFYQVERGPTRTVGGAGLGLHLARKLATFLGGRLEVEPGGHLGATFVLTIPRPPAG